MEVHPQTNDRLAVAERGRDWAKTIAIWPVRMLVDLVSPPECLWCDAPIPSTAGSFCDGCRVKLVSDYYRCQRCASPLPTVVPNADCNRCRSAKWRFDRVLTLGPYRAELRQAVIQMKKPHHGLLRRSIGRLLSEFLDTTEFENAISRGTKIHDQGVSSRDNGHHVASRPLVVAIPNYWTHGFLGSADSAGELATSICQAADLELGTGIVRRIRRTDKQGMLSWSDRVNNVRGAFKIVAADRLIGRHVILVDDVLTSGATCSEVSSRLKQSGAESVTVLVAARGTGTKESQTKSPTSPNTKFMSPDTDTINLQLQEES